MNYSHHHLTVKFYGNTKEIPESTWNEIEVSKSFYFHKDYLQVLENHHSNIEFLYAVCSDEKNNFLGFSHIQLFDFEIDSLQNDWQNITKRIAHFARKFRVFTKETPLRIVNCGLPFVSGNHGIFLHPKADQKKVLRMLIKSISKHIRDISKNKPIDIFIIKDFNEEQIVTSNELINLGYYAFNVEPNMFMKVDPHWHHFDDYLKNLKTKFRVKTKKALSLSKELEIHDLDHASIQVEIDEMTQLYQKVTSKASFNLIDFHLDTYQDLLSSFKENYFVRTYRYKKQLVGFASGIYNGENLDAHFVGIDYDFNKQLAIYQRMLYDYISMAIDKKMSFINFGRTASEIKSSVGAVPEHLTVYIRHKKSITNKFLQLFLHRIQPSEFNQKFPFKAKANS